MKISNRMSEALITPNEHVFGELSPSELKRGIAWTAQKIENEMVQACKACKEKINLSGDKFQKLNNGV